MTGQSPLPRPITFPAAFLHLTNQCTRTCPYCFDGFKHTAADDSRLHVLCPAYARWLKPHGCRSLILTGGEPLRSRWVFFAARTIAAHGMSPVLLTNGDLLQDHIFTELREAGCRSVVLSYTFGQTPAAYQALAERIRAKGCELFATVVLTRRNLADAATLCRWAKAEGVNLLLQPVSTAPEKPLYIGGVGSHAAVDSILAFVSSTHPPYYASKLKDFLLRNELELDRCPIDNGLPIMRTDGGLYACFHLPEPVGHITEDVPAAQAFKQPRTCYGLRCFSLFSSRWEL